MDKKNLSCPCRNKPTQVCFFKDCQSPFLCNFGCKSSHDRAHDYFISPITDVLNKNLFNNCIDNFDITEEELERCQREVRNKLNDFLETIQSAFTEFLNQTKEKIKSINILGSKTHSMRKGEYLRKFDQLINLKEEILTSETFQKKEKLDIQDILSESSEPINQFLNKTITLLKIKKKVDNRMEDITKSLEPYFKKSLKNVTEFIEKFKGLIDNIESFVNSKEFIPKNITKSSYLKFSEDTPDLNESVKKWFNNLKIEKKYTDRAYSGYLKSFATDYDKDLLFKAYKSEENLIILDMFNLRNNKQLQTIKVCSSNNTYPLTLNYVQEYKQLIISDYHMREIMVFKLIGGMLVSSHKKSLESNKIACIFPIVNHNLLLLGYNFEQGKIKFLNLSDFSFHKEYSNIFCNCAKSYKIHNVITAGKNSINLIDLYSLDIARKYEFAVPHCDVWAMDILESRDLLICGSHEHKGNLSIFKIRIDTEKFLHSLKTIQINTNEIYSCIFISEHHFLLTADDSSLYLVESEGEEKFTVTSKNTRVLNKLWYMEYDKSYDSIFVRNGFHGVIKIK